MELAARRFARWVLIAHLAALVVIGLLVMSAARAVYRGARDEALAQASNRQELLAAQTARGIESYYKSILDNLDLQRRAEDDDADAGEGGEKPGRPMPLVMQRLRQGQGLLGPFMWDQLRGRASHFFSVDRRNMSVSRDFTEDRSATAEQIAKSAESWLKGLRRPAISPTLKIGSGLVNLVAVPLRGAVSRVLIAVVPLENVQRIFLSDVNNQKLMSAWLLDQNGTIMLSFDPRLVGMHYEEFRDPQLQALARARLGSTQPSTDVVDHPVKIGPTELVSAMITTYPVSAPDVKWCLAIASGLDEVDSVVQRVFRKAFMWAIFVIISMTGVLVSTSIFMIRARLRTERIKRELLTHELEQARQIQLAWLPDPRRHKITTDVAAANLPASHISGDFYNWFELPDGRTVILIGDVTGHGMAAAFLMATTQLLVRMTMMNHGHAGQCLVQVNQQLCSQGFSGQFVTMLLLVIDTDGRSIEIANAGHPAPLVSDHAVFGSLAIEPQLVLGVEADVEYDTQRFELKRPASVLLYTDGATDALSPSGERFNLERLVSSVQGRHQNAGALIDDVVRSVNAFCGSRALADDLTLVAIQLEEAK